MADELWRRGAGELAALIRDKQVSSVEVVQAHLDRIEAVNGPVNAVTVTLADEALAAARDADSRPPSGPLHGVPFTIKENLDVVGSATTNGVPAFVDALPPLDAPVVERMKAAGAIPLARTNLPEMALRIATDNPLRGRTCNPWDLTRCSGGSSGGEGAALATGMTPIGLGNDIGGSLRNPAFCNGIASIKPTHGRVPMASSLPPIDPMAAAQLMATDGPMARRVADVRLGLEVLNGRHVRDPRSVDSPLDGPEPATRVAALVTDLAMPAPFVEAVRAAGAALEADGWKVVETSPPDIEMVNLIWVSMMQLGVADLVPILGHVMTPEALSLIEALMAFEAPGPAQAFVERWRLQREWSAFLADHPVVVGPTWCDVQFEHDADLDPERGAEVTLSRLQFITPGNLLGIPAVALPAGVVDGLPTGVQVYADLWRDDRALAAAQVIEDALGTITPIDPVPLP
ncbi:MAG TPA: amidase family protein [Acidimicrobiales bacterium]|nr:amidase family protein [Acidimicrobiales bacterium]